MLRGGGCSSPAITSAFRRGEAGKGMLSQEPPADFSRHGFGLASEAGQGCGLGGQPGQGTERTPADGAQSQPSAQCRSLTGSVLVGEGAPEVSPVSTSGRRGREGRQRGKGGEGAPGSPASRAGFPMLCPAGPLPAGHTPSAPGPARRSHAPDSPLLLEQALNQLRVTCPSCFPSGMTNV